MGQPSDNGQSMCREPWGERAEGHRSISMWSQSRRQPQRTSPGYCPGCNHSGRRRRTHSCTRCFPGCWWSKSLERSRGSSCPSYSALGRSSRGNTLGKSRSRHSLCGRSWNGCSNPHTPPRLYTTSTATDSAWRYHSNLGSTPGSIRCFCRTTRRSFGGNHSHPSHQDYRTSRTRGSVLA